MQPGDLTAQSFAAYPTQAQALAVSRLELLRAMPLALLPILLRELITYDWKLPAERAELNRQLMFLAPLTPDARVSALAGFREIALDPALSKLDWVNKPGAFMESLTAALWSTHQMDKFRGVAETYATAINTALPPLAPARPRLGIVVVGAGVDQPAEPLFRKLRPHGVHLTGVVAEGGFARLLETCTVRAKSISSDVDFAHWYIDGGSAHPAAGMATVSYETLQPARTQLLKRIQQAIATGTMGPEELRSLLARMQPTEIGLDDAEADAVLNHFQMSLLTEGSGTQIFATTFVQWAARECIRRAQPETLLVRYAPRQRAQTMNLMLTGAEPQGLDPQGSLVDADLGAYYAWLAMRRLTGATDLRFLVWFEGHAEAVLIGPGLPAGTTSDSRMTMTQVLKLIV